MANIKINGAVYEDVPSIEVPNESGEMVEYKERMTPYEACIADFKARGWTEYIPSEGEKLTQTKMRELAINKQFVTKLNQTWFALEWSDNLILNAIPSGITSVPIYALMYNAHMFIKEIPETVTEIRPYAFYQCAGLEITEIPDNVTAIGSLAFSHCHDLRLTELSDAMTEVADNCFNGCAIKFIDAKNVSNFQSACFANCFTLYHFVMRSSTLATASSSNIFSSTPIASGTGYIYVPSALIDSYKTATNWSVYANQFRALEDYTVDGTTTGELDESKI